MIFKVPFQPKLFYDSTILAICGGTNVGKKRDEHIKGLVSCRVGWSLLLSGHAFCLLSTVCLVVWL